MSKAPYRAHSHDSGRQGPHNSGKLREAQEDSENRAIDVDKGDDNGDEEDDDDEEEDEEEDEDVFPMGKHSSLLSSSSSSCSSLLPCEEEDLYVKREWPCIAASKHTNS